MNFLVGGLAGITATTCIQPMDLIKVRKQLEGEAGRKTSFGQIASQLYKEAGMKGFYRGIDSAIMRQVVYAPIRVGAFYQIMDFLKATQDGNVPAWQKALASLFAGAVGATVGNPFDLALVRFQGDSMVPEAERRNYKNVFDALFRIVSEEGFFSLWKGVGPTIGRACSLNVAMMTSYEEAKEKIFAWRGPGKISIIYATLISSVFTATFSLPFDNMKTKIQRSNKDPKTGKYPYSGVMDCMRKTVAKEGITGPWTGLPIYYFRVGPHAIITLLAAEFFRKLFGITK